MAASEVVHNVGLDLIVDVFRGALAVPGTLYLGLRTLDGASGHPTDATSADTLASNLAEVPTSIGGIATGYARIAITFDGTHFTKSQSGNTTLITGPVETFTFSMTNPSANVNGITHYFLATSADTSGKLLSSAPTGNTYNVANGSIINVTPTLGFLKG